MGSMGKDSENCVAGSVQDTASSIRSSTTAHTPGPWVAPFLSDSSAPSVYDSEMHAVICNTRSKHRSLEECRANARLIAASPDLLAALLEYVERHEAEGDPSGLPEYEQARVAIAKATGAAQ